MDIPDEGSESKQPNEVRSCVGHPDSSEPARPTGDGASDFGKSAMQSTVVGVDQDSQIETDPLGRTRSAPFSGATAGVGNQCVGDFILLEVIGRDGMGVVYKARQLGINRLVDGLLEVERTCKEPENRKINRTQRAARHYRQYIFVVETPSARNVWKPFPSLLKLGQQRFALLIC